MNKKMLVVLAALLVLLVLAIPAQATQPSTAAGDWSYFVYDLKVKTAGCNTFLTTYDYGMMTGTFVGDTTEVGTVVEHCSGNLSFKGKLEFEGDVQSPTGPRTGAWDGQWVILNGTGELANLQGQGTWSGPGAGGPFVWGTVAYEGNIHFEGNE